jgi:hypothetical protein
VISIGMVTGLRRNSGAASIRRQTLSFMEWRYVWKIFPYEFAQFQINGMSWSKVKDVERVIQSLPGVEFGVLITSGRGGRISSAEFYRDVMAMARELRGADIRADTYILTSWFPFPEATTPEIASGEEYPFFRTFLELINSF